MEVRKENPMKKKKWNKKVRAFIGQYDLDHQ